MTATNSNNEVVAAANGHLQFDTVADAFCQGCGNLRGREGVFCSYCGQRSPSSPPQTGGTDTPDEQAAADPVEWSSIVPETRSSGRPERRHLFAAVGLALVAAIVAAAVVLTRPSAPVYDIDAALASVEAETSAATKAIDDATTYSQVSGAADEVQAAVARVDDVAGHIDEIGDAEKRKLVREVLTRDKALLTALLAITVIPDTDLDKWEALSEEASKAIKALRELAPPATKEKLAVSPGTMATSGEDALTSAGAIITGAREKLAAWNAEVARLDQDKKAQLATLKVYSDAVRAHLDKYAGLRNESSDFIERLDDTGGTYEEIYGFLGAAKSKRQDIRNGLAGLTPPAAVAGSHTGLLGVIDLSVQAMQDAATGISEYRQSYYLYDYKSAPSWRRFQQKSAEITANYGNALSAWEKQIADDESRINAITAPVKPAV